MQAPLIHAPGNLHAHDNTFHNSFITQCEALAERISINPDEVTCPACLNSTATGEREEERRARIEHENATGQASLF